MAAVAVGGMVSYPDPLQPSKRTGESGEYSTIFLYLHGILGRHNLIGRYGNYLTCTGLPYHKHLALHVLITLLQTYLAHLQFTEAQQATSKALESIATASPGVRLSYSCIFARPSFPLWRRVWVGDYWL